MQSTNFFLSKLNKIQYLSPFLPYISLPNKLLIGTHHKTGTVWMRNLFRDLASKSHLAFKSIRFAPEQEMKTPEKFDILFQDHSQFDFAELDRKSLSYLGLHIIRDPRDIVVSSCFYHQKSDEKWLHIPRDQFGGKTYQEKINSYSSLEDKLLFEMDFSSNKNINQIRNWNYQNSRFIEVKYEQLIEDYRLVLFHEIFDFLNWPPEYLPHALKVAWDNSLFSGKVKNDKHIRSGKKSQWPKYMNKKIRERFCEIFGDVLITLGYEQDNSWCEIDSDSQD